MDIERFNQIKNIVTKGDSSELRSFPKEDLIDMVCELIESTNMSRESITRDRLLNYKLSQFASEIFNRYPNVKISTNRVSNFPDEGYTNVIKHSKVKESEEYDFLVLCGELLVELFYNHNFYNICIVEKQ